MKKKETQEEITVGGEALMDGIMMRGPKGAAVALRLPSGEIETSIKHTTPPSKKYPILGKPFLRGPVSFVYSMAFGYKCLMESAEKTTLGQLEGVEAEGKLDQWLEKHLGPKMMAVVGAVGSVLGVGLALGLFVWVPQFLTRLIQTAAESVDLSRFVALIAGGMRVVLFVGYMFAMSQIPDIRRVFQYHGAEHKAIFCYEAGLPLTVEHVRAQSRFHPRCGTSFLFVMILLSIILSSVLNAIWPGLTAHTGAQVAIKILQFPVIMSLGFEFIRFAGKHLRNPLVRALSAPGLCMQRITTKEPTDDIIAVGIQALKASLGEPFEPLIPAKEEPCDPTVSGDAPGPGDAPAE
jgi:uncharacterized protein YqhQ